MIYASFLTIIVTIIFVLIVLGTRTDTVEWQR